MDINELLNSLLKKTESGEIVWDVVVNWNTFEKSGSDAENLVSEVCFNNIVLSDSSVNIMGIPFSHTETTKNCTDKIMKLARNEQSIINRFVQQVKRDENVTL